MWSSNFQLLPVIYFEYVDLCFPVVIFFGSLSLACAEGGPDGSHPQNTARCATRRWMSLTQPCHRSHIYIYIPIFRSHIVIPKFPIYSHILDTNSIHAEHGWSVRLKKTMGKMTIVCPGVTWESNSFPDPIIQDVLHVISMDDRMIGWSDEGFTICDDHPLWFQYAKSNGPLVVPLIFQNRKDPKTFPTFYCRILSIFVHHISTSNHLPAPGKGTSSSALALGDGAWRSERSV